jgi:nicotinamide riboside kinase
LRRYHDNEQVDLVTVGAPSQTSRWATDPGVRNIENRNQRAQFHRQES